MTEKNKSNSCDCNCFDEKIVDSSRREFIRKASVITLIGGSTFFIEACGGSSPTSSDNDDTGGGDTGGGDTGGGDTGGGDTGGGDTGGGNTGGGTGDSGYNYNAGTKTITIDTSKIYQSLQNPGNGVALSSSNTFDSRGIIVLRISEGIVRALSRNCTHAGFTVNYDSSNNTLPCSLQGGGHGSVFNSNGNVISGPASMSLTSYNASVSGSIITITQN